METKKEKQKDNRFTYSSDEGLKVLSEKEYLDSFEKKETEEEKPIKKSENNQLKGGKADNMTLQQIADKHEVSLEAIKKQVHKGVKVEMEHTDNPSEALEIVMDHLVESAQYYTKLKEMEDTFEKEK